MRNMDDLKERSKLARERWTDDGAEGERRGVNVHPTVAERRCMIIFIGTIVTTENRNFTKRLYEFDACDFCYCFSNILA